MTGRAGLGLLCQPRLPHCCVMVQTTAGILPLTQRKSDRKHSEGSLRWNLLAVPVDGLNDDSCRTLV